MNKSFQRTEFIVRFICGAIFFGLVVGLLGLRFVTAVDALAIAVWILITVSLSVLVAVCGDDSWRRMAGILRWW
ncbi:MAG: hypothetical protein ACK5G9_08990 [Akkermansiaceae bacterium]